MIAQGDIVKVHFNPQSGHKQAGYRPALVISNDVFNARTQLAVLCPITNNAKPFPLHIPLDDRTVTTGVILCEHLRSLDLGQRGYKFVEKAPPDVLRKVLDVVMAEVDDAI